MIYVIQVLSAILIGISIGVLLGPRHTMRFGGSIAGIVLALVALFTGNWVFLAIGTAIFLVSLLAPARPAHVRG